MPLEALQRAMIAAIDKGPAFIEDEAFRGGRAAAMRGLSVHANTISHARLVALEDTFPRTRAHLGDARFNTLSRAFMEHEQAIAEPLSTIGRHFPSHLARAESADVGALAAFEWSWLETYHAADHEPLKLADFAGAEEERLLATIVARHPAARLAPAGAALFLKDEAPGADERAPLEGAKAILLTRPHAEVLVNPATLRMVQLFTMLDNPQPICNLLTGGGELQGEDGLQPLLAVLRAGSLILS